MNIDDDLLIRSLAALGEDSVGSLYTGGPPERRAEPIHATSPQPATAAGQPTAGIQH